MTDFAPLFAALDYYITLLSVCQALFESFFNFFQKLFRALPQKGSLPILLHSPRFVNRFFKSFLGFFVFFLGGEKLMFSGVFAQTEWRKPYLVGRCLGAAENVRLIGCYGGSKPPPYGFVCKSNSPTNQNLKISAPYI